VVSELSDLEIVGINVCRDVEQLTADEECMREQEFREEYHKGGEAKWQNFYFQNHVLARDVHIEICNHVRQALDENENEGLGVEKIVVYHQPGSGGSTINKTQSKSQLYFSRSFSRLSTNFKMASSLLLSSNTSIGLISLSSSSFSPNFRNWPIWSHV
jgi:hypothetical protein